MPKVVHKPSDVTPVNMVDNMGSSGLVKIKNLMHQTRHGSTKRATVSGGSDTWLPFNANTRQRTSHVDSSPELRYMKAQWR